MLAPDLYLGLQTRGGPAQARYQSAQVLPHRQQPTPVTVCGSGPRPWVPAAKRRHSARRPRVVQALAEPSAHPSPQVAPSGTPATSDSSNNPNKAFVKQLRPTSCTTLAHIEQALQAASDSPLDAQAVTALASALVRLARSDSNLPTSSHSTDTQSQPQSDTAGISPSTLASVRAFALARWVPLAQARVDTMDPTGLGICLHALVSLRLHDHDSGAQLLDSFMQACVPHMHVASPRVQATMMWSVAQSGSQPPQPWLRRWLHASAASMHAYSLHDVSMATWAVSCMGVRPPDGWTRRVLQATQRLLRLPAPPSTHDSAAAMSDVRLLGVVTQALARMQVLPAPELLDACLDRVTQHMQIIMTALVSPPACNEATGSFASRSLSMLAYALMRLKHQPSPGFVRAFIAASAACMPHASSQELCMMVMATCNWQTMPPQGWLTRAEQRSLELMQNGHVTEQGLVLILDGFTQLNHHPTAQWMHTALLLLTNQPTQAPAAAQVLASLGALMYHPTDRVLSALAAPLARQGHQIRAKRWFPAVLAVHLLTWAKARRNGSPAAAHAHTQSHSPVSRSVQPTPTTTLISSHTGSLGSGVGNGDVGTVLSVAREKFAHCSVANLAHLVWALALSARLSSAALPRSHGSQGPETSMGSAEAATQPTGVMQGLLQAPVRPMGEAARGQHTWPWASQLVTPLLAALRQKTAVASASDLAFLTQGLAALLVPGCGVAGVAGGQLQQQLQLGTAGGVGTVLTAQQLAVLAGACCAALGQFSTQQLVQVLCALADLGGSCVAGGAATAGHAAQPVPATVAAAASIQPVGTQEHGTTHVHTYISALATRCLKLLLEGQQQQAQVHTQALSQASPTRSGSDDASQPHTMQSYCTGVRTQLLVLARQQVLGGEGVFSESECVLSVWGALLRVGYLQSLDWHRQHQVCVALYRAAEVECEHAADRTAYVARAQELAAHMPHTPPADWLSVGLYGPVSQVLDGSVQAKAPATA